VSETTKSPPSPEAQRAAAELAAALETMRTNVARMCLLLGKDK
jgi:hypothetical protein